MPPSQLKQLKTSLRDNGILGPQKSKKQKKANNKDAHKRSQRHAALEGIRERFNPFEAKAPARREKFDIASNKPTKKSVERPGVTRGLGEERRRETLLKEMQSRNKVGGMLDRRFGEDDPNMTPEQKAAERFAQQALRSSKKNSMFNLEEDSDEELQLTHGGRALNDLPGDAPMRDDFDEDLSGSEAADFEAQDDRPRKRVRLEDGEEADGEEEAPQRKKTKNEVMQEVIAKSKAYKVARQAQKEDDEDLRAELDKGLGDIFAAMNNHRTAPKQLPSPPLTDSEPKLDPSRAAMLAGKSRAEAEKEYEANVRQMQLDARSKPTFRTKTEEEKAAEDKARLDDLERKRVRRMKGEVESSEDEDEQEGVEVEQPDEEEADDAEEFGLEQPGPRYIPDLAVEDEDQFVMDDILASDSEADAATASEDGDTESSIEESDDDGDDDFINGLVLPKQSAVVTKSASSTSTVGGKPLPFAFVCPQDVNELMKETSKLSADNLPTAVQRIRALYHKGLAEGNEEKLGKFSQALVFWIAALVNNECPQLPSMHIIEQLMRHLHSLAKTQPQDVAAGFREYFRQYLQEDRKSLNVGDLTVLTSISTIFPTSDQWHTVVTPSMLILGKFLSQASMSCISEVAKGVYGCSLALRYQAISKRYVPEVVVFICKAIQLLLGDERNASVPKCTTPAALEESTCPIAKKTKKPPSAKLSFEDLRAMCDGKEQHSITPESLLLAILNLINTCIDYYSTKSAYPELISPIHHLLQTHLSQPTILSLLHSTTRTSLTTLTTRLSSTLQSSLTTRHPLTLHTHRPLAIKSSTPLFDPTYNPTRRQRDPDTDRAELNKLKAEHKKERKGAMRELRKDANFMAREQLREKKVRDEAYEKKFRRLVSEIQGEEGRESKDYNRERKKRQGKGRF